LEPIKIIYKHRYLLVCHKPSGLLSVPGRGEDKQDCLINRILPRYPEALIVHRLDMETSGLLLLARGKEAQRRYSLLFQERQIHKRYLAVVDGVMAQDSGSVDLPLLVDWPNRPKQRVDYENGRPSLTHYRVLTRDPLQHSTRLELEPYTGRSHQLRVHMASLGHPILGDTLYAGEASQRAPRLLLHAAELSFIDPFNHQTIALNLPPEF
jgi:tRNA pseudouridine32 synthase/23S rRNA pseudouridine746 synthase